MIIQLYRGDTPTIVFDVTRAGSAVTLTGYSMFFTAVSSDNYKAGNISNSTYIFNAACDVNASIVGRCSVTLTSIDSMTVGSYIAELSGNEGSGVTMITFGQWELRISQDINQG